MNAPLFIVGAPRSGTTLLSSILDRSPDLVVSPESHYFEKFARHCDAIRCLGSSARYAQFLDRLLASDEIRPFGFSVAESEELKRILAAKKASHCAVFEALMDAYAKKRGARRWAEKTPGHALTAEAILRCFPNAKFIQIIRDPRDVMLSRFKLPWGPTNVIREARFWRRYVTVFVRTPRLDANNYFQVHYEKLLNRPEETMREVCSFLGVAFQPDMLDARSGQDRLYNLELEPWKRKNEEPLDAGNIGKWKAEMPAAQAQVVQYLLGDLLREHGYEPAANRNRLTGMIYYVFALTQYGLIAVYYTLSRARTVLRLLFR